MQCWQLAVRQDVWYFISCLYNLFDFQNQIILKKEKMKATTSIPDCEDWDINFENEKEIGRHVEDEHDEEEIISFLQESTIIDFFEQKKMLRPDKVWESDELNKELDKVQKYIDDIEEEDDLDFWGEKKENNDFWEKRKIGEKKPYHKVWEMALEKGTEIKGGALEEVEIGGIPVLRLAEPGEKGKKIFKKKQCKKVRNVKVLNLGNLDEIENLGSEDEDLEDEDNIEHSEDLIETLRGGEVKVTDEEKAETTEASDESSDEEDPIDNFKTFYSGKDSGGDYSRVTFKSTKDKFHQASDLIRETLQKGPVIENNDVKIFVEDNVKSDNGTKFELRIEDKKNKKDEKKNGTINLDLYYRGSKKERTIMISKVKKNQACLVKHVAKKVIVPMIQAVMHDKAIEDVFKSEETESKDCDICGKVFVSGKNKKNHVKRMHEEKTSVKKKNHQKCEDCGFIFLTKKDLKGHQIKEQTTIKVCTYCGEEVKGLADMKEHRREKHDERSNSIQPTPKRKLKVSPFMLDEMMELGDKKDENIEVSNKEEVNMEVDNDKKHEANDILDKPEKQIEKKVEDKGIIGKPEVINVDKSEDGNLRKQMNEMNEVLLTVVKKLDELTEKKDTKIMEIVDDLPDKKENKEIELKTSEVKNEPSMNKKEFKKDKKSDLCEQLQEAIGENNKVKKVLGNGRCGPNSLGVVLLGDEAYGPNIRKTMNKHIVNNHEEYKKKGFKVTKKDKFRREVGSGKEYKIAEFDNTEEWKEWMLSDESDNMWTYDNDMEVAAKIFGVNIKVVSAKNKKDKNPTVVQIGDIPMAKTVTIVNWNNSHFDAVVGEDTKEGKDQTVSDILAKGNVKDLKKLIMVDTDSEAVVELKTNIKKLENEKKLRVSQEMKVQEQYSEM